jgi:hypothetical protein
MHGAVGLPADSHASLRQQVRCGEGVRHLRRWVSPKEADTEGSPVSLTSQLDRPDVTGRVLQTEVPVLAEHAIKGAGLVKDGQVDLAPLVASCAHPICHTVRGQGIVVPAHEGAIWRTGEVDQLSVPHRPQPTEAHFPFIHPACIHAQRAFNAGGFRRTWRKPKLAADLCMRSQEEWKRLVETFADARGTN